MTNQMTNLEFYQDNLQSSILNCSNNPKKEKYILHFFSNAKIETEKKKKNHIFCLTSKISIDKINDVQLGAVKQLHETFSKLKERWKKLKQQWSQVPVI